MNKQYMAVYVEYAGIAGMIDILHGVGLRYAQTVQAVYLELNIWECYR